MLKSIELYGFKSFADRTRMELDEGVCALVGPNGSGKSNVVDAIKWALGEQSAKRLRGEEMTDVIFNGSASRSALGSAEVTLTFDNSKRILPLDSDEIHLTRRVYRSGESEYLINGQASRLKDFRDLISGIGLGSQGYAVIEQGRVEALLQSSGAQRRAVLEEAAGVSRFNAKKQEVARRLERVEQNLLRLSDIVAEVESQLRKTKTQAGKATNYRNYSAKLQRLRTEVSLYEWRLKTAERDKLNEETSDYTEFEAECSAKISSADNDINILSEQIKSIETELRDVESKLSDTRARIVAEESTIELQSNQLKEWKEEATRNAFQAFQLTAKGTDDVAESRKTQAELESARESVKKIQANFTRESEEANALGEKLNALTRQRDAIQHERQDKADEISRYAVEISGLETRCRTFKQTKNQKQIEADGVAQRQQELTKDVDNLKTKEKDLSDKKEASFKLLGDLKTRRETLRKELGSKQIEFSNLESKRAGIEARTTLLNDLLRKYEGLSPGVKETLRSMRDENSPFRNAYGLVADLIRVNVEAAPLIELALGQTAQYVVVPPEPELFRYIERNGVQFSGRVGFIWLDPNPSASIPLDPKLENHKGVLGRADQFVETEPQFASLVQRLLHRTWIVESIAVAKQLYRDASEPTNFLAADGSLLSADGTLVVGAAQGGAGLISRRSELTELSNKMQKLASDFERLSGEVRQLKDTLAQAESDFEKEAGAQRQTVKDLEDLRLLKTAAGERDSQLVAQAKRLVEDLKNVEQNLETVEKDLAAKRVLKEQLDEQVSNLTAQENKLKNEIEQSSKTRREKTSLTTKLKIDQAKAEERIISLAEKVKLLEESRGEQARRVQEHGNKASYFESRVVQTELDILNAESVLAELYVQKETSTERQKTLSETHAKLERRRAKASFELRSNRDALEKRREKNRTKELSLAKFAEEIKSLEERMHEDYGLNLSEIEFVVEGDDGYDLKKSASSSSLRAIIEAKHNGDNSEETFNDDKILVVPNDAASARRRKKEIEELRGKIQELGSVNLEAIETLETLKTRYTTLFNQYNDLVSARKSIQKIIERVNVDCRRLFEETFNAVREYFCNIFQKLFGGGRADLMLEDPSNPLESGVDVVARPPGKELKNLSLMSGGEKSLTCVALLLAIFQYRTSPICILDEVDAALDEGNVNRFSNALLDFIPKTQFLLVTHSKKTMSSAKAIYGVTMEDSGVSKILSVHFDDVGENGEILIKSKSPIAERQKVVENGAA